MTTEFVLLLGLFAFILMGAFGKNGPKATFDTSAPRLAAKVEKDLSVGKQFNDKRTGKPFVHWQDPNPRSGGQ